MIRVFAIVVLVGWDLTTINAHASVVKPAHPGNYRKALRSLAAGDTLQ